MVRTSARVVQVSIISQGHREQKPQHISIRRAVLLLRTMTSRFHRRSLKMRMAHIQRQLQQSQETAFPMSMEHGAELRRSIRLRGSMMTVQFWKRTRMLKQGQHHHMMVQRRPGRVMHSIATPSMAGIRRSLRLQPM